MHSPPRGPARIPVPGLFIGVAALLGLAVGLGLLQGQLDRQFRESGIVTYGSVILLGLISWTSFAIGRIRRDRARPLWRDPRAVWTAIGAGFAFLALDDLAQVHENLDKLIHSLAGAEATALTDRLDDLIIALYGLAGLLVLWLCRAELKRFGRLLPWLGAGFAILALQVGLDVISNRDEWLDWLAVAEAARPLWRDAMTITEEAAKLFAEAAFLSGFVLTLRGLRAG
ncbi:hypothetical protein [Limimaricola hongkongensis]|uniref:Integral membrane protein n=1 Tax=Limimaricola hongkongensis DSM 17492 TaxID=1122180 RepID=A0A017HE99_9RHOB|nr:hypothetical protein [Limimaricola hongkongensis]EYD72473.1 hypothetical protein Lokhon_01273 [Limimaricola hongkongensis DSM 17492]